MVNNGDSSEVSENKGDECEKDSLTFFNFHVDGYEKSQIAWNGVVLFGGLSVGKSKKKYDVRKRWSNNEIVSTWNNCIDFARWN